MKCKWYQSPVKFKAMGDCSNPVSIRDEVLGRKRADMVCDSCDLNPFIGFPLVAGMVLIPIFVAFNAIFKKD